jgi:hypothetical protein
MDPWLESFWESIHHSYIQDSRAQIADQLPEGLFCEVEETVYIVENDRQYSRVRPDLAVFGEPERGKRIEDDESTGSAGGVAIATPIRLTIPAEPISQMHIVIRSLRGDEPLVTVIEVISPTNKMHASARRKYRHKRRAYQQSLANVVEIDLLRAGRSIVDVPLQDLPVELLTPYKASIRLRADPHDSPVQADYYPLPLRKRLPAISIPLRTQDEDVTLDLQRPIDLAYGLGRYGMRIDYTKPPAPPLSPDDAAWAAGLIAAAE